MGANPTQALAIVLFLAAAVIFSAGLYVGTSVILLLLGLVIFIASVAVFRKAKPLENIGE